MRVGWRHVVLFLRLSRPLFLFGGLLLYTLGAAIADYLGRPVDPGLYLVGLGLVLTIQLMTHFLNEYYDAPLDLDNVNRTPFSGGSGALGPQGLPRRTALYAGIVCLGLAATLASALLTQAHPAAVTWIVLTLIFLGAFWYSVPPVSLSSSGYGELTTALLVAGLVPTLAFVLQTGELHRFLLMTTAPLIALMFAMLIAFELPDYASDARHGRQTLMVRLGWSAALRVHDSAILFAVLAFVLAFAGGLPRRVALGSLMALPLAAAQVWQMARLRRGDPPRWRLLTLTAIGLFALTAYLELVGYLLS